MNENKNFEVPSERNVCSINENKLIKLHRSEMFGHIYHHLLEIILAKKLCSHFPVSVQDNNTSDRNR